MRSKIILIGLLIVLSTSLMTQSIYIIVAYAAILYLWVSKKQYFDYTAVVLLLFSIAYSCVLFLHGNVDSYFNLISYFISPPLFYILGRYLVDKYRTDSSRMIVFLVLMIAFVSPMLYRTLLDISIVGIINPTRAMLADLNNGKAMGATLYGLNSSIGIGCASIIFLKQKKLLKFGYIIISFASLLTTLHLINRTGLFVLAISVFCSISAYSGMSVSKIIRYILVLFVLFLFIDKSGIIPDDIIDSYISRESDDTSNLSNGGGRFEMWNESIINLLTSPMGWDRKFYSHNMWLDLARVGGWFALFPFILATIRSVRNTFKMIKLNRSNFSLLMFSVSVAMIVAAFVEPVIEGSMIFFLMLMLVWGMITTLSHEDTSITDKP